MKKLYCDLHVHSNLSDGKYSPEELIKKGLRTGLSVLCITDHNIVNPALLTLRNKYPQIELPSGCEFSCQYTTNAGRIIKIHVGGIGFEQNDSKIQSILQYNQASIKPFIEKVLKKLKNNCCIDLGSYEDLYDSFTSPNINRRHVALEMVKKGFCNSVEEAFDFYLGNRESEKPAYVSNTKYFSKIESVVSAITGAGGIASLCHTFDYIEKNRLSHKELVGLLEDFKEMSDIRGAIEVYYSSYSQEQQKQLKAYADEYNLLYSAASDYHGDSANEKLGKFPYKIYEDMLSVMKE